MNKEAFVPVYSIVNSNHMTLYSSVNKWTLITNYVQRELRNCCSSENCYCDHPTECAAITEQYARSNTNGIMNAMFEYFLKVIGTGSITFEMFYSDCSMVEQDVEEMRALFAVP